MAYLNVSYLKTFTFPIQEGGKLKFTAAVLDGTVSNGTSYFPSFSWDPSDGVELVFPVYAKYDSDTDSAIYPSTSTLSNGSYISISDTRITYVTATGSSTYYNHPSGNVNATTLYRYDNAPLPILDASGTWVSGFVSKSGGTPSSEKYTIIDPTSTTLGYMYRLTDYSTSISSSTYKGNTFWADFFEGADYTTSEDEDPYSPDGVSYGEGDFGGDVIEIPDLPSLSAIDTGIFSLFCPTSSQMQELADYLWTDIDFSTDDIATVLSEIGQMIKRQVCNPLTALYGLSIIPSQGLSTGSSTEVKVGFFSTGVSMPKLTSQYYAVDCGTLSFDTVCGGTFLDYAPYSKFSIYLPYVGTKVVDANDFVGHTIGVIYHCDVVTGGCTAYVTKDGSTMYQYSGAVALNLPLSSENFGETLGMAVNLAGQITTGAATGGTAGAASAALQGASNVAANPSQLSPQIQHSGAVAGGAGLMGVQVPYIIREAVRFLDTTGMSAIAGYPSHFVKKLSSCNGFTQVFDIHLTGVNATSGEITEIESLLKEGVFI